MRPKKDKIPAVKYKCGRLHDRFMELVTSIVLVCGIMNLIPWFLLLYYRPDLEMSNKIEETDIALAQIAQVIIQRIDSIGSLAEDLAPQADNPLMMILQSFLNQKFDSVGNDDYNRDANGQFLDATTLEVKETPNLSQKQGD